MLDKDNNNTSESKRSFNSFGEYYFTYSAWQAPWKYSLLIMLQNLDFFFKKCTRISKLYAKEQTEMHLTARKTLVSYLPFAY